MTSYVVEGEAYVKIMLHAAKYPHRVVNGILVGKAEGQGYVIQDAFPLFHQHTLAPMLELACASIEAYCATKEECLIVGYYHGNELVDDMKVHPIAQSIADKIESNCSRSCLLLINGSALNNESKLGLDLYLKDVKRGWIPLDDRLSIDSSRASKYLSKALEENAQSEIYDFDDHLEDVAKDWRNPNVYELIKYNV